MSNTEIKKKKENFNVGTIGHVDHGKTTLTSAITYVSAKKNLAKKVEYEQVYSSSEERKKGVTINSAHVEYETLDRHYTHIDCPGHEDYVKNMITGTAQMDAAILVVDDIQQVVVQTREHILLASQIGIKDFVVFINVKKQEADELDIELIKADLEEQFEKNNLDFSKTEVIIGSARGAIEGKKEDEEAIEKLLSVLDKFPLPKRETEKPFLLYIEKAITKTGRGTVVTGLVEQGKVKKGDKVEVVGFGSRKEFTVSDIEMFRKAIPVASAGDSIGILLQKCSLNDVKGGKVVAEPKTAFFYDEFLAKITLLKGTDLKKGKNSSEDDESGAKIKAKGKLRIGGRTTGFESGYQPQFYFKTAKATGVITLPDDVKTALPGQIVEKVLIKFDPDKALVFEVGMRFTIRESDLTIGYGIVKETGSNLISKLNTK
jgi:elongation factor Tu